MSQGLNPVRTAAAIRDTYVRYLRTAYPLRDGPLATAYGAALHGQVPLARGPILEAAPPYKPGRSLRELVNEGLLDRAFLDELAHAIPSDRPLHIHQETAVRKSVQDGRNLVVATGTGSGKTETFLIPILQRLFEERSSGRLGKGVRALLLYPMNALANDQVKRLRHLLRNAPDITFGRYTGETPHRQKDAIEEFLRRFGEAERIPNELLSREEMWESPPHILLTNFAMLEYLLLRPQDMRLFPEGADESTWRFLVLDEAHVYDGAQGTEIGMLLRRLRERVVGGQVGRLRCIATSATLGSGESSAGDVVDFAGSLFGEPFEWVPADATRQDVVFAARCPVPPAIEGRNSASPEEVRRWADLLRAERALSAADQMGPKDGLDRAHLFNWLSGEPRVHRLRTALEGARDGLQSADLGDLASVAFSDVQDELARQELLVDLVDLCVAARPDPDSPPVLPARWHFFVRALEGAFACLCDHEPAVGPRIQLGRGETCEVCGGWLFELASCRSCGQPFVAGQLETREGASHFIQGQPSQDDDQALELLALGLRLARAADADEDDDVIAAERAETHADWEEWSLCPRCGQAQIGEHATCSCSATGLLRVLRGVRSTKNKRRPGRQCPSCGTRLRAAESLRFLTGRDAPVAVLTSALYERLPADPAADEVPGGGRRLLTFADSRQDAAFFASYFDRTYEQVLRRRLLLRTAQEQLEKGPGLRVRDLVVPLQAAMAEAGVFDMDESPHERRRRAAEWVQLELRAMDRRNSLEGVGLLSFGFEIPDVLDVPPVLAEEPWSLSAAEFRALLELLLDGLRRAGATTPLEGVDLDADAFAPARGLFRVRESGSDPKRRLFSWCPSGTAQTNRRQDLLERLLRRRGLPEPEIRPAAAEALRSLWRWLTTRGKPCASLWDVTTTSRQGALWTLRHELVAVRSPGTHDVAPWRRCGACGILTPHDVAGICPTLGCDGRLEPQEPRGGGTLSRDHYLAAYTAPAAYPARVEEHTAQIATDRASEIQTDFIEGRVNVLSCSTTFELGVDVGDLQTVLLRNVPPSPANYIQRAGRAGRRTDSTAFTLTFAQRRPHDLTYYQDPTRLVSGRVPTPHVKIQNEKIVRRHVHSVALAAFFRTHPDTFGNLGTFFEATEGQDSGPRLFASFLALRPEAVQAAVRMVVPESLHKVLGVDDWSWADSLLAEQFARAQARVDDDLATYQELKDRYTSDDKLADALRIQRILKTYRARDLLGTLGSAGVLPKYGFPTDVVTLEPTLSETQARQISLERDLRLAVAEYAPGAEVVANKRVWAGGGLRVIRGRDLETKDFLACGRCGWMTTVISGSKQDTTDCPICDAALPQTVGRFIIPEYGFVADVKGSRRVGEARPRRTYASRLFFPTQQEVGTTSQLDGRSGDPLVKTTALTDAKLVVINKGPLGMGYRLCRTCGYAEPAAKKASKKSGHTSPRGGECSTFYDLLSLGHEFQTDVCLIRFPDQPTPAARNVGFWQSLLHAVLEGACDGLGIRRGDIDGCIYAAARDQGVALVIHDAVPGGAGHAHRIAAHVKEVLQSALDRVLDCECAPESSCYACTRSYQNQVFHGQLRRDLPAAFLEAILMGLEPDGELAVRPGDLDRWLGREIDGASSVQLVGASAVVSQVLAGERSRSALERAKESGRRVTWRPDPASEEATDLPLGDASRIESAPASPDGWGLALERLSPNGSQIRTVRLGEGGAQAKKDATRAVHVRVLEGKPGEQSPGARGRQA